MENTKETETTNNKEELQNKFINYVLSTATSISEKEFYISAWSKLTEEYKQYYVDVWLGKRAISLTNDYVFKTIFDPDIHKERLSDLLTKVIGTPIKVKHSLRNENHQQSELSKKMVMDVVAELSNGEYIIVEMQVARQDFIDKRAVAYSSDLILRQYSVDTFQAKDKMAFDNLKKVYTVIFMVESPEKFRNNPNYIHHSKQQTNTGLELDLLQEYVFIELESFISGKRCNNKLEALLTIMATNDIMTRQRIVENYPEYSMLINDVHGMIVNSKKELLSMFSVALEQLEKNSLLKQGIEQGRDEGRDLTAKIIKLFLEKKTINEIALEINATINYVSNTVKFLQEMSII